MSSEQRLGSDKPVEICPREGAGEAYNDIFCEGCRDWFEQPHILPNGTDVAWPADWSREQAREWRRAHDLQSQDSAAKN